MSNVDKVNDDGYMFKEWFRKADRCIEAVCGLGLDDLPDGPSWDSWNDGVKPKDYAIMMLEEEGFPF